MNRLAHAARRAARALVRPGHTARKVLRVAGDWFRDFRYGGWAGGPLRESRFRELGALGMLSSDYRDLDALFRRVPVGPADVLVDVGCGKGRVLSYWLSRGLTNRLVGLELDPEYADRTRERLRRFPNVTVITGNALEAIPPEGTLFYLYHPFFPEVMERFKRRLLEVVAGRPVTVVYYRCLAAEVFTRDPAWRVEYLDERSAGLRFPAVVARPAPV
jgi:hypothetical protein